MLSIVIQTLSPASTWGSHGHLLTLSTSQDMLGVVSLSAHAEEAKVSGFDVRSLAFTPVNFVPKQRQYVDAE